MSDDFSDVGKVWMSSPLTVRNSDIAVSDNGVVSSEGSKRPLMSGLRAGGTLSIPIRVNNFWI